MMSVIPMLVVVLMEELIQISEHLIMHVWLHRCLAGLILSVPEIMLSEVSITVLTLNHCRIKVTIMVNLNGVEII